MTNYSKADMRDEVLENLKVKDANSNPSAADNAVVIQQIQQVLEYLEDENLIIFDTQQAIDVQNIPARVFSAIAGLVELEVAPKFGKDRSGADYQTEQLRLMRQLRRSVMADPDLDTPVPAKFY